MWSKMLCLNLAFAVLALFHQVTAQTVMISSSEGTSLQERSAPYQICVDLSSSPSGGDLTVSFSIAPGNSATSPEDFQLSNDMLTFVDGTSELQQCIDLTIVADNILEQLEFFTLVATPSSGSAANQLFLITNNDNVLIGLEQESYTTTEADGSVTICVLFLMNSAILDPTISADATLSATDGTAIAVEDYGQLIPPSITLTSTTTASGVCSTINIPQDAIVEGRETFSVTLTAGARAQVVDGRGTAQVVIVDGCGPLPPPDNGNVDASITTVGSVATYSCDNGFLISGDPQRNCQMDGLWSGSAPTCLGVCEDLPDPTSGTVSISDSSRLSGTLATYTCNAGYMLSGDAQRTCQASGMWSGTAPVCNLVTCVELDNPPNGEVVINDNSRVVGSVANYSCNDGFLLSGVSQQVCQDNGEWTGTAPVCSQVTCEELDDPPNGEVVISDNSRVVGSVAEYSCNDGFLMSGVIERVCQADGEWSGVAPSCSQLTCEELDDPPNGEVVISDNSRVVGSVAEYSCDDGFLMSGVTERVCQADGEWSGVAPSCSQSPSAGPVSDNQDRNIGIGVGVGVGGFLFIVLVVIIIAVLILALKKKNTEKYVLNYSTVYGSGVGSTGNDYSSAPPPSKPDGGESGSNGVNERGVDVDENEGAEEEINAITFKEE